MKGDLKERTKKFAHRCVKFAMSLPDTQLGKHIRGQLIRSSTSVAANYRAASHAQTRLSFISKISIVVEECDETEFWIEFSVDEKICNSQDVADLLDESRQITSIFVTARKTAQHNLKK